MKETPGKCMEWTDYVIMIWFDEGAAGQLPLERLQD